MRYVAARMPDVSASVNNDIDRESDAPSWSCVCEHAMPPRPGIGVLVNLACYTQGTLKADQVESPLLIRGRLLYQGEQRFQFAALVP